MTNRRQVLAVATATAAAAALARAAVPGAGAVAPATARAATSRAATSRTLLILGGTGFIGPHLTREAQGRGWTITYFNRGRRDPAASARVETLLGDRNGGLDVLRGRRWDAVVDNTGYVPSQVRASAQLLAPQVGYALFVSSISAYASLRDANDEDAPTAVLADPNEAKVANETYGPMKALCERYTMDAFGARASVVRPGYIVGPLDPTDRFKYWPVRCARGCEMLAPGTPGDPVQVIDVRDLAAWLVTLVERGTTGYFNAVSRPRQFTIGDVVQSSRRAAPEADTRVTWVAGDFLAARWKPEELDLPPWAPPSGESAGAALVSTERAAAAGLAIRPLDETVRDTLAWFRTLPPERQAKLRAGLDPQREVGTLADWHSRLAAGTGGARGGSRP
jgi:2'-hydroxyisoflavone reductase